MEVLSENGPAPQSLTARTAKRYVTRGSKPAHTKGDVITVVKSCVGAAVQKEPESQATWYLTESPSIDVYREVHTITAELSWFRVTTGCST